MTVLRGPWGLVPEGACKLLALDQDATTGLYRSVCIEHADPRIMVADEIVRHLAGGGPLVPAWAELDKAEPGGLLRIRGTNRTVIYRLVEYIPTMREWIAEFPD